MRAICPDSSDNLATASFICGDYGDSQYCPKVNLTEPLMEYGILEATYVQIMHYILLHCSDYTNCTMLKQAFLSHLCDYKHQTREYDSQRLKFGHYLVVKYDANI